tara:strand:+ start:43 stop:315 length:273 start_codon:yes stop_codon:yes gene_type:complete
MSIKLDIKINIPEAFNGMPKKTRVSVSDFALMLGLSHIQVNNLISRGGIDAPKIKTFFHRKSGQIEGDCRGLRFYTLGQIRRIKARIENE